MKKNLLAFGVGVLASICLISLYAFQTQQKETIVVQIVNNSKIFISKDGEPIQIISRNDHFNNDEDKTEKIRTVVNNFVKDGYKLESTFSTQSTTANYAAYMIFSRN